MERVILAILCLKKRRDAKPKDGENFQNFVLTLVWKEFSDGGGQSSFTVIDVAYFIIIKYKLRIRGNKQSQHNNSAA